ncbi:MAG: pilus assembly protein CpaC [Pirellulaceae bacterium]|jgi:pilus assembly protein CpaC
MLQKKISADLLLLAVLAICLSVQQATAPQATAQQLTYPGQSLASTARVQPNTEALPDPSPVHFHVKSATQRLDMLVNTSRIVTMDRKVARLLVNNPELLRAAPLSPNQIQISSLKAGVTQLNMWDENDEIYSIDVIVSGDARELDNILRNEFPQAKLRLTPLNNEVLITGFVPHQDMVHTVEKIALNYYGGVINRIEVGGNQQILLHCKVMEVSRNKMRQLGVDWGNINGNDSVIQTVAGVSAGTPAPATILSSGEPTLQFGIVSNANQFYGFIDALRENGVARIIAEPSLMTISGRPARFTNGGEFPILVPQGQGTVSVEFREYGTILDFVPIVQGNGQIRLEVRPVVSSLDVANGVSFQGLSIPGLRSRTIDTACVLNAGQTIAIGGMISKEIETTNVGIPWLADLPWIGTAFRRVRDEIVELEQVILVTPEFVSPMDQHEVTPYGPGQNSDRPGNKNLYYRGHMEVPMCNGCGGCPQCTQPSGGGPLQYPVAPANSSHVMQLQAQNPNQRNVRNGVPTNAASKKPNPRPTIIGPIGYDVVK